MRDLFYDNNTKGWALELMKQRPDITKEQTDKFLTRMYRTDPDFVFTVTRDFVRQCQTPVLILPDDIPAHPYAVAMETAMLAPNAEVSLFPWKEPKERVPLAVRQIRSFLRAHRPAQAEFGRVGRASEPIAGKGRFADFSARIARPGGSAHPAKLRTIDPASVLRDRRFRQRGLHDRAQNSLRRRRGLRANDGGMEPSRRRHFSRLARAAPGLALG